VCDRWLIQIPRLYEIFRESATPNLETFEDLLNNIFRPLFEVTRDPSSNPALHQFLQQVIGIDCVDDESKVGAFFIRQTAPLESRVSSQ
jgi:AMP deaminase